MNAEEKKDPLQDHLLSKVKKSGYPLEIEVSSILEHESFVVFNSQYYFDEEAKQGRDIDIYAIPIFEIHDRLLPLRLSTDLVIECKKSETHAWVFYTRPRIPMSGIYMSGQFRTTVPKPEGDITKSFEWLLQQHCLDLHYDDFAQIAIAYDEIKKRKMDAESGRDRKNGSSRKEIFEAINQLVKFTNYEMHKTHERIARVKQSRRHHQEIVTLFFPIVVFDGDMFEVFFDVGEPRLERRKHMILGTHYRCPYCENVESYTIDIVHRPYFQEFMRLWKRRFDSTEQRMLKNHSELLRRASEDRTKLTERSLSNPNQV